MINADYYSFLYIFTLPWPDFGVMLKKLDL